MNRHFKKEDTWSKSQMNRDIHKRPNKTFWNWQFKNHQHTHEPISATGCCELLYGVMEMNKVHRNDILKLLIDRGRKRSERKWIGTRTSQRTFRTGEKRKYTWTKCYLARMPTQRKANSVKTGNGCSTHPILFSSICFFLISFHLHLGKNFLGSNSDPSLCKELISK